MARKINALKGIPTGNLDSREAAGRYDNPRGYPGLGGFKDKHPKHETQHKIETSLTRQGPRATFSSKDGASHG